MAVVGILAVAIFSQNHFLENVMKIRVNVRVIWGKRRGKGRGGGEGEAKNT